MYDVPNLASPVTRWQFDGSCTLCTNCVFPKPALFQMLQVDRLKIETQSLSSCCTRHHLYMHVSSIQSCVNTQLLASSLDTVTSTFSFSSSVFQRFFLAIRKSLETRVVWKLLCNCVTVCSEVRFLNLTKSHMGSGADPATNGPMF